MANSSLKTQMRNFIEFGLIEIRGEKLKLDDVIGTWKLEQWLEELEQDEELSKLAKVVRGEIDRSMRLELRFTRSYLDQRTGVFSLDEEEAKNMRVVPELPEPESRMRFVPKAPPYKPRHRDSPKTGDLSTPVKVVEIKTNGPSLLTLELDLAKGE
jgi:hypothetical protein